MRRDYPGRVLFFDEHAPAHAETVTAVEIADTFLSVWTKGMVEPWRETEHDPNVFHVGDEKLAWIDEVYGDKRYRVMGWKQHFHVFTQQPPTLADVETFRGWMPDSLWSEVVEFFTGS